MFKVLTVLNNNNKIIRIIIKYLIKKSAKYRYNKYI